MTISIVPWVAAISRDEEDQRVRCWDCQHWLPAEIPVPVRQIDGRMESEMVKRRRCKDRLGYAPLILRMCPAHRRKRPQHIIPLPASYRQGWGK